MIYEHLHWSHSILPASNLGMEIAVELIQISGTPDCDYRVNIFAEDCRRVQDQFYFKVTINI